MANRYERQKGLPSAGTDYWVYADRVNPELVDEPADGPNVVEDGKWMLFYPKAEMDARWLEACEHMQAGRFGIVESMKASTFKENPRSSDHGKGVIIIYTPQIHKDMLMETGRLIMNAMQYGVTMYFKTNEQTHVGTRATGVQKNHTFYLRPQVQEIREEDVLADW